MPKGVKSPNFLLFDFVKLSQLNEKPLLDDTRMALSLHGRHPLKTSKPSKYFFTERFFDDQIQLEYGFDLCNRIKFKIHDHTENTIIGEPEFTVSFVKFGNMQEYNVL